MVCFDVTEESDEPLDPAAVPPMETMFGSLRVGVNVRPIGRAKAGGAPFNPR
jgi:hypothetical protein